MKKLFMVAGLAMLLTLGGTALAGEKQMSLSLGGQMGLPMGDFGDVWKSGMGGNGRIGFQMSPAFEIGGTFGYSSFGLDSDGLLQAAGLGSIQPILDLIGGSVDATGGDMTVLEIIADFKYFLTTGGPDAPFKPYLTGSVGMASISLDDLEFSVTIPAPVDTTVSFTIPSGSETAAAFGVGAGFEYMFSPKVGFWLDGKYMLTSVKVGLVTSEVDVAYLPIRAGVKFMFGGTGE